MLSPRLATYRALPGGATVTRDGSGALGTSGVVGRDVSTSLGFVVCATADGASALSMTTKPKERKRIVASDAGPSGRKVFSVKAAVFPDATLGQIALPDNVG